jgi:predicted Zn-dependent peptidase
MPLVASTPIDGFSILSAPGGVQVHLQSTRKYKSVYLQWVVERPLDERRAAFALLPDLLTRGTRSSPGLAQMAARCEDLYATELHSSVSAHGPVQLLRFGLQTIADRHAEGRPVFRDAVALLAEVMHDPPLEDGRFKPDVIEQERTNLVHAIEGIADDKGLYAYRCMIEAMHAGTPRALHSWGTVELGRALDEPTVRAAWREAVTALPARLFIVGDVTEAEALAAADALSGGAKHVPPVGLIDPPQLPDRAVQRLTRAEPLNQSKLAMGFRIPPELLPGAAATLFGLVFGGESHSRLFKRVREKESLAYGCSAAVSIDNATLVVQAGVDAVAAARTQELVLEELVRLARDGVSAEEVELSRRAQRRRLRNLKDSPRGLLAFRLSGIMNGRAWSLDRALEELARVTPDEVAAVAAGCALDTIFLLEGTRT